MGFLLTLYIDVIYSFYMYRILHRKKAYLINLFNEQTQIKLLLFKKNLCEEADTQERERGGLEQGQELRKGNREET